MDVTSVQSKMPEPKDRINLFIQFQPSYGGESPLYYYCLPNILFALLLHFVIFIQFYLHYVYSSCLCAARIPICVFLLGK